MRWSDSIFTVVLFAFLVPGAAIAVEVKIDFDPAVDFSRFKTIGWLDGTPAEDPMVEKRIRVAVERELIAHGFKEAREDPDLLIVTHASVDKDKQIAITEHEYWSDYRGWKRPLATSDKVWESPMGALIIDILDASSRGLIWRGVATGNVAKTTEKRDEKINRTMAKLFRKFPPK